MAYYHPASLPRTSGSGPEYDVFLSFRGEDTRKSFAAHLYQDLVRAGIRTFRDEEELPIGEDIGERLFQAITVSRLCLPLLSRNYASSKWCRRELVHMVETGVPVLPVFLDMDFSAAGLCLTENASSFGRLNEEEKEKWQAAITEVRRLPDGLQRGADGDEAVLVNLVVQKVLSKLNHTPLYIDKKATGINRCVEEMMVLLDLEVNDVRTVGICGPAGIGKTTIAKAVHNRISGQFDRCVLENIGELSQKPNGLVLLQKKLRGVAGQNDLMIKSKIGSTRMLVLLDGIDRPSQVDALESWKEWLGPGSRIIITTKYESILNRNWVLGIYKPKQSDPIQSIQVLGKHDFYRGCPADSWEIQLRKHPTRDWTQCGFGVPDKDPLSPEKLGASGILGIYIFFIASLAYVYQIPKSQLLFFSAG